MTVENYIKSKFQPFDTQLSEAEILDITLELGKQNIAATGEVDETNIDAINIALTSVIPALLARINVSESGFSTSRNISGIKEYYAFLCRKYSIENELSQISDASDCW